MNDGDHPNDDLLFDLFTRAASIHVPRSTVAFLRAMREDVLLVFNGGNGISVTSRDPKLDAWQITRYFIRHPMGFLGVRNMKYIPEDQMDAWCSVNEPEPEEDSDDDRQENPQSGE